MSVTFSVAYDAADTIGFKVGCYCGAMDDGRRFGTWAEAVAVAEAEGRSCVWAEDNDACGAGAYAEAIEIERPMLNVANSNAVTLLTDLGFDMTITDYCGGSVTAHEMASRVENARLARDHYTAALVAVVMEASKLGRAVTWG